MSIVDCRLSIEKQFLQSSIINHQSSIINPIELLWEQLSDDVLRLHRDSDDWATLKERVCRWLSALTKPSQRAIEMAGLTAFPAIRVNAA